MPSCAAVSKRYLAVLGVAYSGSLASGDVASKWRNAGFAIGAASSRDVHLHALLTDTIPAALEHTGAASFDEHLTSLQAVLRAWAPEDEELCDAALFHSIYGTEGYAGFSLPWHERPKIRALIGSRAERLAWLFCAMDRATFDSTVLGQPSLEEAYQFVAALGTEAADGGAHAPPPISSLLSTPGDPRRLTALRARPELGAFLLPLHSEDEWLDLVTLVLADYLEQVEGAAQKVNPGYGWSLGEAWGYRRHAYAAMAKVLARERPETAGRAAAEMHAAVYGAEPASTKHCLTARTPPLSDAAKAAQAAMASIDQ